jgi:hypothetical protein
MDAKGAWIVIIVWLIAVLAIAGFVAAWNLVAFILTYGFVFGGIAYRYRGRVRPAFKRVGLDNYKGFVLLSVAMSVMEEVWCFLAGCDIAYPVLWVDLIIVSIGWQVWFSAWYFFLSRRYWFGEREALMVAALVGVLYEVVGTGRIFTNPMESLLIVPAAVVIYAALFVLPMQLIDFRGKNRSRTKYPVSVVLPFLLTIPLIAFITLFL